MLAKLTQTSALNYVFACNNERWKHIWKFMNAIFRQSLNASQFVCPATIFICYNIRHQGEEYKRETRPVGSLLPSPEYLLVWSGSSRNDERYLENAKTHRQETEIAATSARVLKEDQWRHKKWTWSSNSSLSLPISPSSSKRLSQSSRSEHNTKNTNHLSLSIRFVSQSKNITSLWSTIRHITSLIAPCDVTSDF